MFTLLAAALLAAPAAQAEDAASAAAQGEAPKRVRSVMLFDGDTCPKPAPDEIVVCARAGDSPYRIPEAFREKPPETGPGASWVRRVEVIDEVNRVGLPGSCSAVGTGGQTGCNRELLRQWAEEREQRVNTETSLPDDQ